MAEALLRATGAGGAAVVDAKVTSDGATPLHLCAQYGHAAVARALLRATSTGGGPGGAGENAAGAVVNAKTKKGFTPLHRSAESGHAAVTEVLLLAGKAKADARGGNFGLTPLHKAAFGV